jgi:serine/threonine-protein phosphatase Stp1
MALRFRSASATHAGCVREENQDAVLALDARGLWAVSDGVGGLARGEMASAAIVAQLSDTPDTGQAEPGWIRAQLDAANRQIMKLGAEFAPGIGMAATAAVLSASSDQFFCLWAGDCRIYRLRAGRLTLLTHDHRFVQELMDQGAIDAAAARNHPQRNIVTRAFGVDDAMRPQERQGTVANGDAFILVTDGVTAVLDDAELEGLCAGPDIGACVPRIVARCLARAASDNLSLIVVRAEAV